MSSPSSRRLVSCALVAMAAVSGSAFAGDSIATYRVQFNATWSMETHPQDFPNIPHFSGLIGGTHHVGVHFWEEGGLATPGIESMAETGSKTMLRNEVNAAIGTGDAEFLLTGNGINRSPGSTNMAFVASTSHPLVTLVSMIAPSPDWFVGVDSLPLAVDGVWQEEIVVHLAPYDAGTDSGTTYNSPNQNTDPQEPIRDLSDEYPFEGTPPLGTFTFTLVLVDGCLADFNNDEMVNTQDVMAFLNAWNAGDSSADINADQMVNTRDVLAFLNLWTTGCE